MLISCRVAVNGDAKHFSSLYEMSVLRLKDRSALVCHDSFDESQIACFVQREVAEFHSTGLGGNVYRICDGIFIKIHCQLIVTHIVVRHCGIGVKLAG